MMNKLFKEVLGALFLFVLLILGAVFGITTFELFHDYVVLPKKIEMKQRHYRAIREEVTALLKEPDITKELRSLIKNESIGHQIAHLIKRESPKGNNGRK